MGCVVGLFSLGDARLNDARAEVTINISKKSQQLAVSVNGAPRYRWLVSTGRKGYGTPVGTYRPQRLERHWFSRKYYNAPMPYSIFFHKGYAIHGTTDLARLGGVASHGCVRLNPSNAAALFALVEKQGMKGTRIVVSEAALSTPQPLAKRLDSKPAIADEKPALRPQAPRVNPAESLSW
jgi:lipoprotein-anchoring transpeptidase ErfK/SrfK